MTLSMYYNKIIDSNYEPCKKEKSGDFMINIYKTVTEGESVIKIDEIEAGTWINLVSPDEHEIHLISKKLNIPLDFLYAALDDEESSRIEIEDDNIIVVIDIPFTEKEENSLTYDTYPLAII